jgi:hypothetical protein
MHTTSARKIILVVSLQPWLLGAAEERSLAELAQSLRSKPRDLPGRSA